MAAAETVRVDEVTSKTLDRIAEKHGMTKTAILNKAVAQFEESLFWAQVDEASEKLVSNQDAKCAYAAESALFDNAIADGLADE